MEEREREVAGRNDLLNILVTMNIVGQIQNKISSTSEDGRGRVDDQKCSVCRGRSSNMGAR